jgi:hypothetical protein
MRRRAIPIDGRASSPAAGISRMAQLAILARSHGDAAALAIV